ncbi:uncharacterized protein LOC108305384 [Cebus imitator]|uniref:uncharacterized protein LOC108305384 n=1 Tax=Cebus imitator TaxID=2715852 RepID=UPI000809C8AD|nr:uncharacterized protein LOC108305384 [Cebus imitator]
MGRRVVRAVALVERLFSSSRPGRPLRGPHSGADRGASQKDSGDCRSCGRRLVHARLLQPLPPPLPPHILPALPGSCSGRPVTNGRRVAPLSQSPAGPRHLTHR